MPVNTVLGRLRQENNEFNTSVHSKSWDFVSEQKNTCKNENPNHILLVATKQNTNE